NPEQRAGKRRAWICGGHGSWVSQEGVSPGNLTEREREGLDAARVDRGDQAVGPGSKGSCHRGTVGDLGRVVGLPVRVGWPVLQSAQQDERRVLAGAVVPNRSGLLAVACQPSGRERVQRCIFRSTSEHALAESGASVDGLEGTDV